jgi:hypothetical protein
MIEPSTTRSSKMRATGKSQWKQNQAVKGVYCNIEYSGKIDNRTRDTPCGKQLIFGITLDKPIFVYGSERLTLEIQTNEINTVIFN